MSKLYELELYKLMTDTDEYGNCLVSEFGWVGAEECCAWINYRDIDEFMQKATGIFGYGLFDDGSFDANMQSDGICVDICKAFGDYIDIKSVFPKSLFDH